MTRTGPLDRSPPDRVLGSSPSIVARALSRDAAFVATLFTGGIVELMALGRDEVVQRWSSGDRACGISLGDTGEIAAVILESKGAELWSAHGGRRFTPARVFPCGERRAAGTNGFEIRRSFRGRGRDVVIAPQGDALITTEYEVTDLEEYYGGGYIDSSARCRLWSLGERPGATELLRAVASNPISYTVADELQCARVVEAEFSACGRWFALRRNDDIIELWAREGGRARRLSMLDAPGQTMTLCARGLLYAIRSRLVLWPLGRSSAGPPPLSLDRAPTRLATSPDGRWLAVAFPGGHVDVFDTRDDAGTASSDHPIEAARRLACVDERGASLESLVCGDSGHVVARYQDQRVACWFSSR